MRFSQTCDPSYPHSAVVFAGIGVEGEPAPSEYCATFTAPQGAQQVGVNYQLAFSLPTGTGVDCGNGTCHFNFSLKLLDANGNTLDQRTGYATPPTAAAWDCYDDPESPPAKACFSTAPAVVDVSGLTANGPAELTLAASLGTESGYWGFTQMEIGAHAGELVGLKTLKFDYEAGVNDAITMKIDESTEIPEFEWQAGVRETPATEAEFTAGTIAPAAYVAGQPLRVKARFTGIYEIQSAVVKATVTMADGSPSPYGELGQQTISFDYDENFEWVSTPLAFTSTQSATAVAARDLRFNWQIVSVQFGPDYYRTLPWWLAFPSAVGNRSTTHRIYTLWKTPVAPMTVPWAKVLELSSPLIETAYNIDDDEDVVKALANGIFYSAWTEAGARFFKPMRAYRYDPRGTCSCGNELQQFLDLTFVLYELASSESNAVPLQCNDTSNLHAILAASQGIAALPTFIHDSRPAPPGYPPGVPWKVLAPTALYQPAGGVLPSENPCVISAFTFHQVASLVSLYDTSARSATGSQLSCTPGPNFFGLGSVAYMTAVFPSQEPEFTTMTRPTVGISNQCAQQ